MDKSQKVAVAVISAGILIGVAVIVVSGTGLPSFQQMPFRAARESSWNPRGPS